MVMVANCTLAGRLYATAVESSEKGASCKFPSEAFVARPPSVTTLGPAERAANRAACEEVA